MAINKEHDQLVETGGFVQVTSQRRQYARFFGFLCVLWTFGSLIAAMLLWAGWPDIWQWPYLTACIVLAAHILWVILWAFCMIVESPRIVTESRPAEPQDDYRLY